METSWSEHYTFEVVGEGIHAAIARRQGNSICNSGLVDLGEAALVFDTGLTPDSAKDLSIATRKALGRPPSLVANSHWHLDHTLGNQEFATSPIWGTRRTREILLAKQDQLKAETAREVLEKDIRELESHRAEMRTDGARDDLEFILQINRALLSSAGSARFAPPDHTFETRLALPGSRGAELVSFGSGHTEADAILHLPRDRVVFAGDLVVLGVQPSLGSGDPERWLGVLDQIERLGAERIVPGHGPVTTPAGMQEIRDYVGGVLEAAGASRQATLPAALRRWESSLSLEENLKFTRGWIAARK